MLPVEDLSTAGKTPREDLTVKLARIRASRGYDVPQFTEAYWATCGLCKLPCEVAGPVSLCCLGPVFCQGWHP